MIVTSLRISSQRTWLLLTIDKIVENMWEVWEGAEMVNARCMASTRIVLRLSPSHRIYSNSTCTTTTEHTASLLLTAGSHQVLTRGGSACIRARMAEIDDDMLPREAGTGGVLSLRLNHSYSSSFSQSMVRYCRMLLFACIEA